MSDTTTIKIQRTTKATLDQRRHKHEPYDAVIARLLQQPRHALREQLIEAAKASRTRDRDLAAAWTAADAPWPR